MGTYTDRFRELVRKLKIKGSLHILRHTFASHLAMAGTPIPVIKKLLGRSDITTTMIYAHLAPDHLSKTVDKLKF
jgi:site-specific recombinase XerD